MNIEIKGKVLVDAELVVETERLAQLADAIGTKSASETAMLVPFFGPTAAGQDSVVGPLEMSLQRGLQGGQSYEWHRAFVPGETVRVTVVVEDILDKGTMHLATVLSEYRGVGGELIQRQRTVFVERPDAAAEAGEDTSGS
jgi:hypothetical protein